MTHEDRDTDLKGVINSILQSMNDFDTRVNESLQNSLCKIAVSSDVNVVVLTFCDFLKNNRKLNVDHIGNILRGVEQICIHKGQEFNVPIIELMLDIVVKEMTSNPEYIPCVELPASNIIAHLGIYQCEKTMASLLELVIPNTVPHYTVLHTIGSLSRLNMNGIVPYIKKILAKLLLTLPMVKQDHVKQAYAYAFSGLAAALIDFFNNEIENEITRINKDNFRTEFSIIFETFINNWLNSNEPRVIENILGAIAPMINLISYEKHKELMPKLIHNILGLYKKPNIDLFEVTQALSSILQKTVCYDDMLTTTTIDFICTSIFNYIITIPDFDHPKTVKNNYEVLRCFKILFDFSNTTLNYLHQRTKSSNEEDKMKSIVVFTHLLAYSENLVVANFISTLIEMSNIESSIKMKNILLKAIVALADKNVANIDDYSILLEFIIRQINTIPSNENIQIYNNSKNALYLLSSTANGIKAKLWPLLLKAFMVAKCMRSVGIITKSLLNIVQTPGNQDFNTDTVDNLIIDANEAIFVRCMSLLNVKDANLFVADLQCIINFLLKYCTTIHGDLAANWEVDLRNLSTYLNSIDIKDTIWESMIIDLFRSAIYAVNDNQWIEGVLQKILEQISTSENSINQKGILYKILGVLLCNVVDVHNIEIRLDIYFGAIMTANVEEGKYIAEALGIASVRHGIRIIERLDDLAKGIMTRKTTRFMKFNFMKNAKNDANLSILKFIITLCYGQISTEITDINLLNKLVKTEVNETGTAIRWIVEILQSTSSSPTLLYAALNTLNLFAKAIYSLHNNTVLHEKGDIINLILTGVIDRITNTEDTKEFPVIIKAIASLVSLPRFLTAQERNRTLRILFSKIVTSVKSLLAKTNTEMNPVEKLDIINRIQTSFDTLTRDFIVQLTCPSTLDDILSTLDVWLNNELEEIRIIVLKSIKSILSAYIQNIRLTFENPSRFNQSGLILGRMLSKCTDTSAEVRTISIDCIKILIKIIDLYEGRAMSTESENSDDLEFGPISDDPEQYKETLTNVVNVICDKIQPQQINSLIESVLLNMELNNTLDQDCCIALDLIFQIKGQDLYQQLKDIMVLILNAIKRAAVDKKEPLLYAIISFTKHHPRAVIDHLLTQSLPFEKHINDCWKILMKDSDIALIAIEHFMETLSTHAIYEECPNYDNEKVASALCLAVISAMCEMLSQPQAKTICENIFPEIFSTLYIAICCLIGSIPPTQAISTNRRVEKFGFVPNIQSVKISPARIAIDALKALLLSFGYLKIFDVLLLFNDVDSSSLVIPLLDYVSHIVKIFCEDHPQYLLKLVETLNKHARANLIPQRLAVVAFFSHLIALRCNDNLVMLETVIATLDAGWGDPALEVRAVSLSGLGNVKYLNKEQRDPLLKTVLTFAYRGLEDHQGINPRTNIPLITMITLTDFLAGEVPSNHLIDSFIPIAHRIKAFMNTESAILREASIRLFGEIVLKRKSDILHEQALLLFPCFLLHLADNDVNVIKACKQTLRKITPTFEAPLTNDMIQRHMIDTANLHISDFLCDLIKCFGGELSLNVQQMIESTTNYLNSPWDEIRGYACIMIGLLFANFDKKLFIENNYDKHKKAIIVRYIQLLKDKNPNVRAAAATGLSGFYQNM